jgi:hypothetical protein
MSNEKLPAIVSDALSRLEELKVSPVNLSPQYLRMEKGEHRKVSLYPLILTTVLTLTRANW